MTKPGLIYRSKNPRVPKNKTKDDSPAYWKHNAKAYICIYMEKQEKKRRSKKR